MKITVTRALAELKLLDSKINDSIRKAVFIDTFQNRIDRCNSTGKTKLEFESDLKAEYQSITDLIKRRIEVKAQIIKSNAETMVKIGENQYSVAEAIDRKTNIEYEKTLLNAMKKDFNRVNDILIQNQATLDENLEKMLMQSLGADRKKNKEDYDNIAKPFIEANALNKIDPLSIEKTINKLEDKINTFLTEVDFVLSESNAKTKIELKD